jgi:GNAT superfamily N-acetyltransferase
MWQEPRTNDPADDLFSSAQLPPVPSSLIEEYDSTHPLDPETARGITNLFRLQYGPKYPHRSLYDPILLAERVVGGQHIAVVLKLSSGEVVGHGALVPLEPGTFEVAKFVVDPSHRRMGYGKMLNDALLSAASRLNPDLLVGYAVTAHPASQKLSDRAGFRVHGIHLLDWPDLFGIGQRESAVVLARLEDPALLAARSLHIAAPYAAPLRHIYSNGGLSRTLDMAVHPAQVPLDELPIIDTSLLAATGSVQMRISERCNPTLLPLITRDALDVGARHISASIDITHPSGVAISASLYAAGFLFASVLPTRASETLTLQLPVDLEQESFGKLNLAHDTSRELLSLLAPH